ncbi:unnamed protein product [Rhizoctonia solani]|uniref:Uncharacterized protein n=1 Tax=Rhizoctonia solani TaxID=456999 RepID=A0A8H3E7V0_9AGAM|nr:unnamed protein product [Rhizoctonia solani]
MKLKVTSGSLTPMDPMNRALHSHPTFRLLQTRRKTRKIWLEAGSNSLLIMAVFLSENSRLGIRGAVDRAGSTSIKRVPRRPFVCP